MIHRFLGICVILLSSVIPYASAQDEAVSIAPTVSARIETDSVGIGDIIRLSIEVEQDMMQVVAFPDFNFDGEDDVLEMVGEPTFDTIERSGRRVKLRREYLLRTFDAGLYNLGRGSVLYMDKNLTDTIYAPDSLKLMVGTFLIDSTSHTIFDIKPLRDLPFKFDEISDYTMWAILALLLLAVLVYIVMRIMAHYGKPLFGLFKPAPPVAPHIAAFAALDELRSEHLWQSGEYKGYYSRLTDILRTYISGRYGVAAMEMTSPEIIAASKDLDLPARCEMELQELLRDADLVKFAKAQLDASDNERYFDSAKIFVELTMEREEEADLPDGEVVVPQGESNKES